MGQHSNPAVSVPSSTDWQSFLGQLQTEAYSAFQASFGIPFPSATAALIRVFDCDYFFASDLTTELIEEYASGAQALVSQQGLGFDVSQCASEIAAGVGNDVAENAEGLNSGQTVTFSRTGIPPSSAGRGTIFCLSVLAHCLANRWGTASDFYSLFYMFAVIR